MGVGVLSILDLSGRRPDLLRRIDVPDRQFAVAADAATGPEPRAARLAGVGSAMGSGGAGESSAARAATVPRDLAGGAAIARRTRMVVARSVGRVRSAGCGRAMDGAELSRLRSLHPAARRVLDGSPRWVQRRYVGRNAGFSPSYNQRNRVRAVAASGRDRLHGR